MLALPIGMAAQVDDLYYVPTKKKAKKEIKAAPAKTEAVIIDKTNNAGGTQITRLNNNGDRFVNGRSEDEYNRRVPAGEYSEEVISEEDTTYIEEGTGETDYTYSTRIVRFHSPRRSTILSSPLYWNVVYESEANNWTIYDDGVYWDVYPEYTYTTMYSHPWHYPSWSWNWNYGYAYFGWHYSPWHWGHIPWHWSCNPWHWGYPYEWYSFGWAFHNHNHGLSAHGPGAHRPSHGGYRNATYTGRNGNNQRGNYVPRATGPARADRGVRATTPRTNRDYTSQVNRTERANSRTDNRTNRTERVYDRPSSTRNNVSRAGVTRTRSNESNRQKINWIDGFKRERTNNSGTVKDNSQIRRGQGSNGTYNRNSSSGGSSSRRSNGTYNPGGSSRRSNGTYSPGSSSSGRSYGTYNSGSSGSRSSVSNSSSGSSSRSSVGSSSRSSNFSSGGGGSHSRSSGGGSRGGGGGSRSGGGGRR